MAVLSTAIGTGIVNTIKDSTVLQGLFGGSGSNFRIDFPADGLDPFHHNQNDMVLFFENDAPVEAYDTSAKSLFSYTLFVYVIDRSSLSINYRKILAEMYKVFRTTNYSSSSLVAHMADDSTNNVDLLGNSISATLIGPEVEMNKLTDAGGSDFHQFRLVYSVNVLADHVFPQTIS